MNRIMTLLSGAIVAAGAATFAFAGPGHEGGHGEGETTTVTGELIDTACFVASDGGAKGEGHAECAQKCLASGIPAGVLPEGGDANSILFLTTNPVVLAEYAGQTVKVEGVTKAGMKAIDVKKVSVKQEDGSFKEVQLKDYHHQMSGGDDAVSDDAAKDDHSGHGH